MRYLVTGATGFIGLELCRQIGQSEHQLIAFSLRGSPLPDGTPTRAVDFSSVNLTAADLDSVDVVFHLAGIAHQRAKPEDYDAVNHRAAVELARQAQVAGVKSFVFLSSVKAMGPGGNAEARLESDCVAPLDSYGQSKRQAESGLNREFADSNMRISILRPALVYGQEAKANLALLSRLVDWGLPRPPGQGARSMISSSDLCTLMQTVAVAAVPGVSTFIATDGEAYSTRRIYDALREARGMKEGAAWCPAWVWRLVIGSVDLARRSPDSTWSKLFATELYSNRAVLQATQWRPGQSFESMLLDAEGML